MTKGKLWLEPLSSYEEISLMIHWTKIYRRNTGSRVLESLLTYVLCASAALFGGYSLRVNASDPKAVVRLPFPQSTTWYLTLQLLCYR